MFEVNVFLDVPAKIVIKQDIAVAYMLQLLKDKEAQISKIEFSDLSVKKLLSVEEASDLFGIGRTRIRELSDSDSCPFVLWVGSHRKIKREAFEKYLTDQYSV